MASLGVDVISSVGEFCRSPYQGFVVDKQRLRSRAYLLATGSRPTIPKIDGLQKTGYITPAEIWQENDSTKIPQRLVVIGGTPNWD